jgi:four helix bundle protein
VLYCFIVLIKWKKKYLTLNDIESYTRSFKLSNTIWEIIILWNSFAKDTIGKQFVRAADSISANIAEGFARHSKKEKVHFYRIAKKSVSECLDWNQKSKVRKLITDDEYNLIFLELKEFPRLLNTLIKYTNQKLKQ